jgi:hypothetical protein
MRDKVLLALGFLAKPHCAMQYNKEQAIANRYRETNKNRLLTQMLRVLPRFAIRLLAALVPLALGACADTLTSEPIASNAQLQRGYDKTMTKTEQAAAISDLAQEKLKQEQAVQDSSGGEGSAAPVSAKPAAQAKSAN